MFLCECGKLVREESIHLPLGKSTSIQCKHCDTIYMLRGLNERQYLIEKLTPPKDSNAPGPFFNAKVITEYGDGINKLSVDRFKKQFPMTVDNAFKKGNNIMANVNTMLKPIDHAIEPKDTIETEKYRISTLKNTPDKVWIENTETGEGFQVDKYIFDNYLDELYTFEF